MDIITALPLSLCPSPPVMSLNLFLREFRDGHDPLIHPPLHFNFDARQGHRRELGGEHLSRDVNITGCRRSSSALLRDRALDEQR